MIELYRAMSLDEYNKTTKTQLSYFKNKEKPFGSKEFVINVVCNGIFNNSKFKPKYTHLIKIKFDRLYKKQFHRFGLKEQHLLVRDSNFKYEIEKLGEIR